MTLRGGVEGMMVRGLTQSRHHAHSGYLFPTSGSDRGKLENVTGGMEEGTTTTKGCDCLRFYCSD